jgi:UDP-N-acetylmuramoyl-L-alanyl-D-glutamate--2,6-diaminopimelate ligase
MQNGTGQVRAVQLRELLPDAEFVGADDIRVDSCCGDSRSCRPGDLFVALPGTARDGHDFVFEATQRGASAVLANRPTPGCNLPACYVEDTRSAYGRICQALVNHPSWRLKTIGITGTNGKTTTSYLVAGVLAAAGFRPGIIGTLGYFDGDEWESAPWTTPPAPTLANWMARMEANACTHAVLEVSSHALSQSRVAGIEFDVACLSNVRHDHLDYHGTWRNYCAAKARLFEQLLPEGFAVINADDEAGREMLLHLDGPVLTVGIDSDAELSVTPIEQCLSEQTFLLNQHSETIPVRTRLIGRHNMYNCLTAAAVGVAYGIDLPTIVRGLEAIDRLPGRLERLECGQPFGVFVDFAHTADALTGSLETLRDVTNGRIFCVFGAGGDRDRSKRPRMGRAVEAGADVSIVTSDNPRSEDPQQIIEQILTGFRRPAAAHVVADRGEAIRWALSLARPGDCVLIAGKGHEEYQIIGQEKLHFSDRDTACEWLYEAGSMGETYDRASA